MTWKKWIIAIWMFPAMSVVAEDCDDILAGLDEGTQRKVIHILARIETEGHPPDVVDQLHREIESLIASGAIQNQPRPDAITESTNYSIARFYRVPYVLESDEIARLKSLASWPTTIQAVVSEKEDVVASLRQEGFHIQISQRKSQEGDGPFPVQFVRANPLVEGIGGTRLWMVIGDGIESLQVSPDGLYLAVKKGQTYTFYRRAINHPDMYRPVQVIQSRYGRELIWASGTRFHLVANNPAFHSTYALLDKEIERDDFAVSQLDPEANFESLLSELTEESRWFVENPLHTVLTMNERGLQSAAAGDNPILFLEFVAHPEEADHSQIIDVLVNLSRIRPN